MHNHPTVCLPVSCVCFSLAFPHFLSQYQNIYTTTHTHTHTTTPLCVFLSLVYASLSGFTSYPLSAPHTHTQPPHCVSSSLLCTLLSLLLFLTSSLSIKTYTPPHTDNHPTARLPVSCVCFSLAFPHILS